MSAVEDVAKKRSASLDPEPLHLDTLASQSLLADRFDRFGHSGS
jgi:hypothetical protein